MGLQLSRGGLIASAVLGGQVKPAGGAYTGPGDVVSGATAWYGLRAYSAAYAAPGTNNAINIRRASDNATLDIVIKSDGTLDVAAVTAFLAATTGFITKLYDQSGNTRDAAQVTAANQPLVTLAGLASTPCIGFDGNNRTLTGTIPAIPSPQSGSAVYIRTNPAATNRTIFAASGLFWLNQGASANQVSAAQSLSAFSAAASDNVWHAIQSVLNGASSGFNVDGTFTSGTTTAITTATTLTIGGVPVGQVEEIGVWPIAFNATQYGNLNTNQHTYWGF